MVLATPGGVKSNINALVLALNSDVQPDFDGDNHSGICPGALVTFQMACNVRGNLLEIEIVCIRLGCQEDSCSGGYGCPGGKTKCVVQCLPRGQRLSWKKKKNLYCFRFHILL